MKITYFNRHQSMDSDTRFMILDIIRDLRIFSLDNETSRVENWLFGSFDGYDYSEIAMQSKELNLIKELDSELNTKICKIFSIIEKYPRTIKPNCD